MTVLVSAPAVSPRIVPLETRDTRLDETLGRARVGDKAAFGELYRRYANRVYATCLRLTQDRSRAEQFTQDAFVRAWEKLDQYRGDAAFATWLHRLAVNVVLADRRRDGRRRVREQRSAEAAPERVVPHGRVDASMDLERAMSTLPDRCRLVFVLYEVEGLSHEEIAEALEMAIGTSKSQLHRARTMLKEALS